MELALFMCLAHPIPQIREIISPGAIMREMEYYEKRYSG